MVSCFTVNLHLACTSDANCEKLKLKKRGRGGNVMMKVKEINKNSAAPI